jgi:hypothetical protein
MTAFISKVNVAKDEGSSLYHYGISQEESSRQWICCCGWYLTERHSSLTRRLRKSSHRIASTTFSKMPSLVQKCARPFRSKAAFLGFVRTDEVVGIANSRWTNNDLEPTPPSRRYWNWYNLPLYWMTTAFGTAGWNLAASLIATGLVRESFP